MAPSGLATSRADNVRTIIHLQGHSSLWTFSNVDPCTVWQLLPLMEKEAQTSQLKSEWRQPGIPRVQSFFFRLLSSGSGRVQAQVPTLGKSWQGTRGFLWFSGTPAVVVEKWFIPSQEMERRKDLKSTQPLEWSVLPLELFWIERRLV